MLPILIFVLYAGGYFWYTHFVLMASLVVVAYSTNPALNKNIINLSNREIIAVLVSPIVCSIWAIPVGGYIALHIWR